MYRPTYCADCGEKIQRTTWRPWTNGRFCEDCEKQIEPWHKRFLPFAVAVVALLGIGIFAGQFVREKKPLAVVSIGNQPTVANQNSPVKQQAGAQTVLAQTTANQKPQAIAPIQQNQLPPVAVQTAPQIEQIQTEIPAGAYYCGARTQKGTLCSRRVRGAGRCWQHVGKAPMVAQEKLLIR